MIGHGKGIVMAGHAMETFHMHSSSQSQVCVFPEQQL